MAELTERNQALEDDNYEAANKLELEFKKYQSLQSENKHLKETLRQGDLALIEREGAIVERDRYIDQLEANVKQMHAELMKKNMMLKSAQEHVRVPTHPGGLNPMNMYMGQTKSET